MNTNKYLHKWCSLNMLNFEYVVFQNMQIYTNIRDINYLLIT